MSLLAAFNGRVPVSGDRRSAKPPGAVGCHGMGSTPNPLAKLFERSRLPCFKFILSRLIPVGRFTGGAHFRFPFRALARHPFVLASAAPVALLLDGNRRHDAKDISDNNILSRYILCLTDIYLSSNIFLR